MRVAEFSTELKTGKVLSEFVSPRHGCRSLQIQLWPVGFADFNVLEAVVGGLVDGTETALRNKIRTQRDFGYRW